MRAGTIANLATAEASNGDELLAASLRQLDDGADFIKLYLDGPDPRPRRGQIAEVAAVVEAAHARQARVTAHAGRLNGAQVAVEGGVDAIEHGFSSTQRWPGGWRSARRGW